MAQNAHAGCALDAVQDAHKMCKNAREMSNSARIMRKRWLEVSCEGCIWMHKNARKRAEMYGAKKTQDRSKNNTYPVSSHRVAR